jgi:hypothetical protein
MTFRLPLLLVLLLRVLGWFSCFPCSGLPSENVECYRQGLARRIFVTRMMHEVCVCAPVCVCAFVGLLCSLLLVASGASFCAAVRVGSSCCSRYHHVHAVCDYPPSNGGACLSVVRRLVGWLVCVGCSLWLKFHLLGVCMLARAHRPTRYY